VTLSPLARAYAAMRYVEAEHGSLRYTPEGRWKYIAQTSHGMRSSEGRTALDAILRGREPATEEG
jgi:hypothetical protein